MLCRREAQMKYRFLSYWVLVPLFVIFTSTKSAIGIPRESTPARRNMKVTVMVPADMKKYSEMITDVDFNGAAQLLFIKKNVVVPYSEDRVRASAEAAAREVPNQGGPRIIYLKIKGDTAYIVLNIDVDGWAGVSFSIATCHPIIEKTLLQFKSVKKVLWQTIPGDRLPDPYEPNSYEWDSSALSHS